ncbi:hypothetical protein C0993_008370 [Termitomyces sp. T159_Od127]|nr:hypothetical protein C0993_008370 [Termitomyces sp. T159_Od127]
MSQVSSSLFSVLIGINKYRNPSIVDLQGAVNDANAVEDFLVSEVGASKDRIVNLRDQEATREGIVDALRNLANHSAIRAHDPILIYFAGHGSDAPSPAVGNLSNGAKGRALLPHDFGCDGANTGPTRGYI